MHLYKCNYSIKYLYNQVKHAHLSTKGENMDSNYEKRVGMNIRNIRIKRKLTQEQLSAKLQVSGCDVTRSALAKIEVGQRHIYLDEIKTLKQILSVEYEELLRDINHS